MPLHTAFLYDGDLGTLVDTTLDHFLPVYTTELGRSIKLPPPEVTALQSKSKTKQQSKNSVTALLGATSFYKSHVLSALKLLIFYFPTFYIHILQFKPWIVSLHTWLVQNQMANHGLAVHLL